MIGTESTPVEPNSARERSSWTEETKFRVWLLEQTPLSAPPLSDLGPLYPYLTSFKEQGEQGWGSGFTWAGETGGLPSQ